MRNIYPLFCVLVAGLTLSGCPSVKPVPPHPVAFGTGIYLDRSLFDGDRTRELVELAANAGFTWSREEFHWDQIEPERGVLDDEMIGRYDRAVGTLRSRNISILGLLAYRTPWSSGDKAPQTDTERADYAHYAATMVERYRSEVHVWEVWNEPNLDRFWPPESSAKAYAALLRDTYRAIKQADPTAKVVGCATSGVALDFIRDVLDAGGGEFMDILSVHPYSGYRATDVSDERQKIRQLRQMLEQRGLNLPIWVSEMGFQTSTNENGVPEAEQGELLARSYATLFAEGVDVVVNYDFADDGNDPDEGEQKFGLVYHNLEKKPAYYAMKNTAGILAGARYERTANLGIEIEAIEFSLPNGNRVWVIWAAKRNEFFSWDWLSPAEVTVPIEGTLVRICGLYGQALSFPMTKPVWIQPSESPVFIESRP